MKVNDYLRRLDRGPTKDAFLTECPHHVLVELEAKTSTGSTPPGAVTEHLNQDVLKRQSLASRDARVFEIRARKPAPGGVVLVGRAPHCDVWVDDHSVSKEHARFLPRADDKGGFELVDLGSTNGTFVNHRRLDANAPSPVATDDVVAFGRAAGFQLLDPGAFFDYLEILRRFGL